MALCFLILSRAISSAFNAKMPVAAAHLLKFPLPGKEKVFGNQRFPLDNVGRYFGKPILATDPNFNISSGFLTENFSPLAFLMFISLLAISH
jgi:hypothetical protein